MVKSRSKAINQVSSHEQEAMERYSASADERETVCCFFDFHEMREAPRKTQKPVVERRVSKHPAQSLSQKALSLKSE
jgi:hypothetical protein